MLLPHALRAVQKTPADPGAYINTWGNNNWGTFASGNSNVIRGTFTEIPLSDVSQIATAGNFSLAVKTDGTLWAWGENTTGQLGTGDTLARSSPVQIGTLSNWSKVVCSANDITNTINSALAIKTDGTLWAWGINTAGRLGDGTTIARSSPVQIGTLTNWKEVAVIVGNTTTQSTVAVKTDGTLWTWGANNWGQLGSGTTIPRSSPVQVGTLTNWRTVGSGNLCAVLLKTDNTYWTAGIASRAGNAALGVISSPVQIGTLSDWSFVSVSGPYAVAIKTGGSLWAWGTAASAAGDGSGVAKSSPVRVGTLSDWISAAPSGTGSIAIRSNGSVWAWGENTIQNGNFPTVANAPVSFTTITNAAKVSGGFNTNTPAPYYVLTSDGGLNLRGSQFAQVAANGIVPPALGNAGMPRSSPVQIGAAGWKTIIGGEAWCFGIRTDNSLYAWGRNNAGVLGLSTQNSFVSPVLVSTNSYTSIGTMGSGTNSWDFTVAVRSDGTLWSWGDNTYGQLGSGTTIPRSSPVQVGTLSDWRQVAARSVQPAVTAIKTNGTLWTWGSNSSGVLAGGAFDPPVIRSSPVQVGTLTNWSKVVQTGNTALALKTDGTIWSWGNAVSGSLGTGVTTGTYASPVQIGTLTTWIDVYAG